MKYHYLGSMILWLGLASCGSSINTSQAPTPTESPPSVAASPSLSPSPASPAPSDIQRDFAPTTPLPATGQVTLRGNIRDVASDRLIRQCPSDSAPYAFAESTRYLVQICSAEYDPWLPKYYISQAKDGSGNLELTNSDPNTAQQLIFPNGDYTYILDRDSVRTEQTNAYLEIHHPDGQTYAEALLYFYEQVDRPTP
jgi:hypothetical protein